MNPIKANEIKVGDILFVTTRGGFAFTNQKVKDIDLNDSDCITTESTDEKVTEGFGAKSSYYTFYLIERPKKPLPTAIGSVVEADGQTWVLCDPDDEGFEWRSTPLGHWASSEGLQEYDFTVV